MPFLRPSRRLRRSMFAFLVVALSATMLLGQLPGIPGFGGPGGGPESPDIAIVDEYDADKDGILNAKERAVARQSLQSRSRRGPGGRPPRSGAQSTEGPVVSVSEVEQYPDEPLYSNEVLRTIFLEFENKGDWEQELADFKPTDVEIPATMTVDGKTYPNVGVSFRGASSFFMIPAGSKRSLNLSVDFMDDEQRLYGYKTLNLLNCNGDASLMSSYLYHDIASKKIAAPKVNFVKVVINNRSWGVYANAQQFNKDFLKENYESKKGARWKVNGSPQGDGGLRYLGEDLEPYRSRFEIKSKDEEEPWKDLVNLCRVLEETPAADIETALAPILDVDGALWFLAVDVALVNSDGYWTRASDYSIYQNKQGVFHILPHDMNEAFHSGGGGGPGGPGGFGPPGGFLGGLFGGGPPRGGPGGGRDGGGRDGGGRDARGRGPGRGPSGPGGRGGPGGGSRGGPGGGAGHGGVTLHPLVGLENDRMPLRSKLLANPALRERYLGYVRLIAEEYLAWEYMGPKISAAKALIDNEVKQDSRKLMSYEAFAEATNEEGELRKFCEQRREYLLGHAEIKQLAK